MSRPVIVGMNNPLSRDPEHALYPYPPRCTGHRLYEMMREYGGDGMSRARYLGTFERRNVLVGEEWSLRRAREAAPELRRLLAGRTVVYLGQQVLAALELPRVEPLTWQSGDLINEGPARWCLVPHPSGLNRWYNDESNRAAAARLLLSLCEGE